MSGCLRGCEFATPYVMLVEFDYCVWGALEEEGAR